MQLHVVGARHYITDSDKLQAFLKSAPDNAFLMMCEPDNPYDCNAIAVYEATDKAPVLVAYISQDDLPKSHKLLKKYHTSCLQIKVLCIQPGRHTTLLAYPCHDDKMIMEIDNIESHKDNFDVIESALPNMPLQRKQQIYAASLYLRDNVGCDIPQKFMTDISRNIEQETFGLQQRNAQPSLTVNGNVNQLPMGNGVYNPPQLL